MSCHSDVGGCSLGRGESEGGAGPPHRGGWGVNAQPFFLRMFRKIAPADVFRRSSPQGPPQEPGGLRASSAGAGMSCHVMSVMYMSCHVMARRT